MKFLLILRAAPALGMLGMLPGTALAQSSQEQHAREMIDIAATPPQDGGGAGPRPYSEPSFQYDVRPSRRGIAALAYHVDTGSSWLSFGHKNLALAKKRAMDGCNAATGGGCYIAGTLEGDGEMFIAEDAMGQFWIKADPRPYGAPFTYDYRVTNPAVIECQKMSFGCSRLSTFHAGDIYLDVDPEEDQSEDAFPKGKLHWNRWAMVAQPTTRSAAGQNKSWLVSGKLNSAATRKEILDRCQAESGAACTISAYAVNDDEVLTDESASANGLLVHFVDRSGQNRWTSAVLKKKPKEKVKKTFRDDPDIVQAPDPQTVKERVDRLCPSSSCRVIATYDAATPRMQVIEDVK